MNFEARISSDKIGVEVSIVETNLGDLVKLEMTDTKKDRSIYKLFTIEEFSNFATGLLLYTGLTTDAQELLGNLDISEKEDTNA